jgi:opacity protein-like surface antigen
MKSSIKVAVVAFFAIGISAYAQVGFVRPEISYLKITNSVPLGISGNNQDLKGTVGYGVAGGSLYGEQNEHEISLSISFAESKASVTEPFAMSDVSGTVNDSVKLKTMTILANYRYYTGAKADPARFYVGPSIGTMHITGNETATATAGTETMSDSEGIGTKNPWTAALAIGVTVKLADKIDLDLGYRYTYGLNKSWGEHVKSNSLYAGVGFKF